MPDALVGVTDGGVYFSVNGGQGRAFLGQVVARLISHYGPVTVEHWSNQPTATALTLLLFPAIYGLARRRE